jgi:rSAM/selenodomain-associated transferase 2
MKKVSIIIPVFNEAQALAANLPLLQVLRKEGHELIVVDGSDDTLSAVSCADWVDRWLLSAPGRARQMNVGAACATGDIFLFLHIDTRLPVDAMALLGKGFATPATLWGRFDVCLSGQRWAFRVIETMINLRSRLSGVATGDQAIFISQRAFKSVHGFPDIPLMEDVAISKTLRQLAPPLCLRSKVITSSRRWEAHGVGRTILLMWWIRLLYSVGVSPQTLRDMYAKKAK